MHDWWSKCSGLLANKQPAEHSAITPDVSFAATQMRNIENWSRLLLVHSTLSERAMSNGTATGFVQIMAFLGADARDEPVIYTKQRQ